MSHTVRKELCIKRPHITTQITWCVYIHIGIIKPCTERQQKKYIYANTSRSCDGNSETETQSQFPLGGHCYPHGSSIINMTLRSGRHFLPPVLGVK